ncbi:MAG: cyclic lactone autoinducer peptide [Oscillospiraceae bacterium]|nr:cyclic lactone autoinducer peptide [Oscillospiraceae bacterium]
MGFIRNLFLRYLHIIAAVALAVTTLTVNSTCLAIIHQEKLPDNALKLRRF